MRELALLYRQIGDERRSFFRNPAAAGFTFIFPVMFLLIFGALYGDQVYDSPNGPVKGIQFQMAQILVFSVVGTTFVSLVISLALRRDTGELKRKRGTPVSPVVILGGIVGNGVLMALFMSALVIGISVVVFGAEVDLARLPVLLLTLIVGSLAFCALGAAVAAFVPNGDAAPAFANLTIFPLYFISGVFIPDVPDSLARIAGDLPLRPFLLALSKVFNPGASGAVDWGNLAVVAGWGLLASVIALRYFRWTPKR
jgi:ABC-2 type transport system permease protein